MKAGIELIIGASIDKQFGPIIMCGSGGIYTEILNDVTFRLAPIDLKEAMNMIGELKIYSILKGARKQKEMDIAGIADTIKKVSEIISSGGVSEIDLNPIIVSDKDATVVDALIFKE
jgi:acyl-CoA synthetase (NDP forming)